MGQLPTGAGGGFEGMVLGASGCPIVLLRNPRHPQLLVYLDRLPRKSCGRRSAAFVSPS
jgi:hypothetical protein